MKNLSLIINGVLAVAVAILFYQVHSLKSGTVVSSSDESTEKAEVKPVISSNTTLADSKLAFLLRITLVKSAIY